MKGTLPFKNRIESPGHRCVRTCIYTCLHVPEDFTRSWETENRDLALLGLHGKERATSHSQSLVLLCGFPTKDCVRASKVLFKAARKTVC